MTTDLRSLVMLAGHCSACRQPAEQRAGSVRWWHIGEICEWRSVSAFNPFETYPVEGGGFGIRPRKVKLPARFIPANDSAGKERL